MDRDHKNAFPLMVLGELSMMTASNAIREKPNWWEQYKDPIISAQWKQEMIQASTERGLGHELGDHHIEYIFKELEWHAEKRQQQVHGGANAPIEIGIDRTRRSDDMVTLELKDRLLTCVDKLMDIPDHLQDWDPMSTNQVLHLIDPSLFPLVTERTRTTDEPAIPPLEWIGQGNVLPKVLSTSLRSGNSEYTNRYQWLPTDFEVDDNGKVKIQSYINNLHPEEHKDMYSVLEEIFERFLPLFEDVLTESRDFRNRKQRLQVNWNVRASQVIQSSQVWIDWYDRRVLDPPHVRLPEFEPPQEYQEYEMCHSATGTPPTKTLQVHVRMINIELTPENPKYSGSSWRVEGMESEKIVASGIYYYHLENMTECRLQFRVPVDLPQHERNNLEKCRLLYGLGNNEPIAQGMDGIRIKQDRCIVYPNTYYHQVPRFELADASRSGSCRMLMFFLVDPDTPKLSTKYVPPQQKEWERANGVRLAAMKRLPPEIMMEIERMVDWPMGLEEAKKIREDVWSERMLLAKLDQFPFGQPFGFL
ncbi:hypothetical protein B0O80DRAFT_392496 [Mortierella sp. GBAus27b]|nr:hypothetical protein B0O80DRAFT_392496 [Mortierella sp. GBAus27b]